MSKHTSEQSQQTARHIRRFLELTPEWHDKRFSMSSLSNAEGFQRSAKQRVSFGGLANEPSTSTYAPATTANITLATPWSARLPIVRDEATADAERNPTQYPWI